MDGLRTKGFRLTDEPDASVSRDADAGYRRLRSAEVVRAHRGDTVTDRVGRGWDFDEGGELRSIWHRLAQSSCYSQYLARQVKACERGLLSASLDSVDRGPVDGACVLPQAGD